MKDIYSLFIGMSSKEAETVLLDAKNYLDILDQQSGPDRMAFMITALMFISDGGQVPQPFDEKIFRDNLDKYLDNNHDKVVVRLAALLMLHADNKHQQEAVEKLKTMHKPLVQGTTNEIAKTLGISKSEVRKLKREGKLDEFLALL